MSELSNSNLPLTSGAADRGHEFLLLGIGIGVFYPANGTFLLLRPTLGRCSKNSPKAVHMHFEEPFEHQMAITKEGFLPTECEGEHDSKEKYPTTGFF